jgi:hypothetical protein
MMDIERTNPLFHLSNFCHVNPPRCSVFSYFFNLISNVLKNTSLSQIYGLFLRLKRVPYRERSIQFYHKDGNPFLMSLVTVAAGR